MSKGVKLLVCGFEASGKSTISSQLDDAMVFNFDQKEYGFQVPHANLKDYTSMTDVVAFMVEKINQYKEKFGKMPKTVVLDTVTQLYTLMQKYNADKYRGFDIHTMNNKETSELNEFVEKQLIPNGINVVIVAHTIWDEATSRHLIPATGSFSKAGSWLSVVNDSVFVEKKNNKLLVHLRGLKYPCRSTLKDLPETVGIEEYNLQDHITKLENSKFEATEFCFD